MDFLWSREVGEFLSDALAEAMTKAVLTPLETIRFSLLLFLAISFAYHPERMHLHSLLHLIFFFTYLFY